MSLAEVLDAIAPFTDALVEHAGKPVSALITQYHELNLADRVLGTELANQINEAGEAFLTLVNPELKNSVSKDWPFGDFKDAFFVAALYLLFITIGSFIMKAIYGSKEAEREAEKQSVISKITKEPILLVALLYNPTQVILCGYMMYAAVTEAVKNDYTFLCNSFDSTRTGMAAVLWVFYLSKILDFVDTIIIVIRRKWRQLSFLHIYHHLTIFLVYWMNTRIGYDGDVYYTIVLNSFVHFVMYGYYQLTTLNIPVPKTIKMLVTKLQMFQFVTMNGQAIYLLTMGCEYPRTLTYMYFIYILSLLVLFQDFSNKTYKDSKSTTAAGAKKSKEESKKRK